MGHSPLSEEQLVEARAMRVRDPPATWGEVGRTIGCTLTKVRYALDKEYRGRFQASTQRQVRRQLVLTGTKQSEALFDPGRDGVPMVYGITAAQCGDPPAGRREMLEAFSQGRRTGDEEEEPVE